MNIVFYWLEFPKIEKFNFAYMIYYLILCVHNFDLCVGPKQNWYNQTDQDGTDRIKVAKRHWPNITQTMVSLFQVAKF